MKSRIRILPDQREICTGYQWEKRKRELRERAGGICEAFLLPEEIFNVHPVHVLEEIGDAHHLRPRSKGRDDRLENLALICREVHILLDNRKVQWTKKVNADA